MKTLSASCLCGTVKMTLDDDFDYAGYCHCKECQKISGSAFAAFGGINKNKLQIIEGGQTIGYYYKSEKSRCAFCSVCGSSLFTEKTHWDITNLRLGLLDNTPSKTPDFHIYMASAAPWHHFEDRLPKFDKLPE
ncbi:MAG: GFA family protein [Pseudomonadales bacterium]|nr:GFA family protein [Pseudomonadales bacterium]